MCKQLIVLLSLAGFLAPAVFAQSQIRIVVDTRARGTFIPAHFIGLSFGTATEKPGDRGIPGHLFRPANKDLVTLFREMGIRNLRLGGVSVDNEKRIPTRRDIDLLFGFAKAAGVKVIYSVRLLKGNPYQDASIARYVWKKYGDYLDCFTIGNEPDWHYYHIHHSQIHEASPGVLGSAYPSYFESWKKFATIIADSVPGARFAGPDAGSNYPVRGSKNTFYRGRSWTLNFAIDASLWKIPDTGSLAFVTQHNYAGENAKTQKLSPSEMVREMLSPVWDDSYYPALYKVIGTPVLPKGLRYRLTESNSFSGGVKNGSDCFATALFSLDYLYWWAEHHCLGVNFHTTPWLYNGTICLDSTGNYRVRPMGYGIKAFDIGGHGDLVPVRVSNRRNVNITVYAVKQNNQVCVTLINKTYGKDARNVSVEIEAPGYAGRAKMMFLESRGHNVFATSGISLGGARIEDRGSWKGKWTPVRGSGDDRYGLALPHSTAAILEISTGSHGE